MNSFTIKDIENITGIKAHTIRVWEQRYNFLKPQRSDTNIRYYSNNELITVLNIALLNKNGFKISHIDKMSESDLKAKILSLSQAQAQQERTVNELVEHMIELDVDKVEKILDNFIAHKGIERTITQIIFPFLERIGILWLTNRINPAQEHLVTNIIRQKLILGIDGVKSPIQTNKSVLLFLPEGEHHELGLLFIYYLLKSRGIRVYYIGANAPLKDVEYLTHYKPPTLIYSHLTAVANNFNFERFLFNVGVQLKSFNVIISGLLTQNYKKKVPANVSFKKSLNEVMEYIAHI
jgi:DNA-binding transcriptional MerR regulator